MQSTVHLFNTALARLGGAQLLQNISSLEQDTLGSIAQNIFPHVLDMALSSHAWAFATRRKILARTAQAQGNENPAYMLAYEIPTDCVKLLRLEGHAGVNRTPSYVVEGRTIRCNEERPVLAYVSRVDEPALWPPAFADALAWALAGELASARNNDRGRQQWCYQNYKMALSEAMTLDQAGQKPHPAQSAWNAARQGA